MSEIEIDRETASGVSSALDSPPSATALEMVRPVRRRRSSPRKPRVSGSEQLTGDLRSEPTCPSARILANAPIGFARVYRHTLAGLIRAWRWLQQHRQRQLAAKRLALCETVSLGEKRFVAIVKVDGQQFLLGGAAGTVSMLARLNEQDEFASILRRRPKSSRSVQ
jgi:Flagellar biosynthesis protein, FliO